MDQWLWLIFIAVLLLSLLAGLVYWIRLRYLQRYGPEPFLMAEGQFVDIDGFQVHYVQQGSGHDILLLHGLGASNYCWRFVFGMLSKKYRVTAIDLPGFGKSSKWPEEDYGLDQQAERLLMFIDQLNLTDVGLVGSSMGGALALWLYNMAPERFSGCVVISPATHSGLIPMDIQKFQRFASIARMGVQSWLIKSIMRRVVSKEDVITQDAIENSLSIYKDTAAIKTFIKATSLIQDSRIPSSFSSIQKEVLLLWGEKDRIVPEVFMKDLAKILVHVEYKTHSEGGHHLMEDHPEWVHSEINRFFSQKTTKL